MRQTEQIDTVFSFTNDTIFNLPNGINLTANDQGLTSFYTESNPESDNCDKRIHYTVEVNFTDKDNDGFTSDVDCNDNNASINPSMEEIVNNGIDEDCDGMDLLTLQDQDGDGFLEDVDCDDNNASINPNMEEIANSGVDENCDGESLIIDEDGDGWNSSIDCDDTNATINGGATEIANNGIDEDCNGEDLINTSIHELGSKVINIYPNPFNDNFVVDIEGDYKNLRLKITTILSLIHI